MVRLNHRVVKLDKENGTFFVFADYESEDMFDCFLKLIEDRLCATVTNNHRMAYSASADLRFSFGSATAMFQEGLGCFIRVDTSSPEVIDKISDELLAADSKK